MTTIFNSGNPDLSKLWLQNPGQAVLECRLAMITEGTIKAAANKLRVGERTLRRWIKQHPEIKER